MEQQKRIVLIGEGHNAGSISEDAISVMAMTGNVFIVNEPEGQRFATEEEIALINEINVDAFKEHNPLEFELFTLHSRNGLPQLNIHNFDRPKFSKKRGRKTTW